MIALSGVRNSCDTVAREFVFGAAGFFSLLLGALCLLIQTCVIDGQRGSLTQVTRKCQIIVCVTPAFPAADECHGADKASACVEWLNDERLRSQ
jgi:hypothetical protein